VPGIEGELPSFEKHFEPGIEVHWSRIRRKAYIGVNTHRHDAMASWAKSRPTPTRSSNALEPVRSSRAYAQPKLIWACPPSEYIPGAVAAARAD
jgi:hypothetical protein